MIDDSAMLDSFFASMDDLKEQRMKTRRFAVRVADYHAHGKPLLVVLSRMCHTAQVTITEEESWNS